MTSSIRGARRTRVLTPVKRAKAQDDERLVHQFRLAALELERSRLLREKRAAEQRIDGIVGRLTTIQQTMRQHRELLDRDETTVAEPPALRVAPRVLRY